MAAPTRFDSRASSVVKSGTGAPANAPTLARQVSWFEDLFRKRDQQYAEVHRETQSLTNTADDIEMELVFAMDRAEFAESQLNRYLDQASSTYKVQAQRVSEFQKSVRAVSQHLKADDESYERRERIAWVISRLRLLQPLCQLCGELSGADADPQLSAVLRQCEEKLTITDADSSLDQLATEFSLASPLSAVWPLLMQRQSAEDTASVAQEQWLLPQSRSPQKAKGPIAVEDEQWLQREIESLTDRNETLRQELAEEARHRSTEAEAMGAVDGKSEAAKECEAMHRNTQKLVEEKTELQNEVARLQTELGGLESQAAPVRLQLGCERSTVAAHREEIARCRAAVAGLSQRLRKLAPPDATSRARQTKLALLRRELTEAYGMLAALEAPEQLAYPLAANDQTAGSHAELAALERRLDEARSTNMELKVVIETRNGPMSGQSKHLENRNGLIGKVAKNSKEITDLKERLRREELQEERIKHRAGASGAASAAPGGGLQPSPTQSTRSSRGSGQAPPGGSPHSGFRSPLGASPVPGSVVVATTIAALAVAPVLAATEGRASQSLAPTSSPVPVLYATAVARPSPGLSGGAVARSGNPALETRPQARRD